jgi:ABC-type transporter Mla subunit MlaD
MARAVSRNNVIAGSFVVASMILAIAISVAVSGVQKRLTPTNPYTVRFSIEDGTGGLKVGSPVSLGGQEVGRVTALEFARENDRPKAVDVRVRINSSIGLYQDAWAFLERPLLGSMSTINITRVGGEPDPKTGATAAPLKPGDTLPGLIAPPSFLAQAGVGPDQVRQVRQMIGQASGIVDRIDRFTQRFDTEFDPDIKAVHAAIDDVRTVTSQIREKVPGWTQHADSVLSQVDDASGRLKPIADQISGAVADADKAIKDFQEAIQTNRPAFDRIVSNVEESSKGWRQGAANISEASQRLDALIQEQTPNLRTILANLRLAADEVKLTMIEVRRNPWRLLYTPKTKELESELFYDAARTYAIAVSDLKAASEALEIASKADAAGGSPISRETLQHITDRLQEAFQRYAAAEQELLKRMESKGK